MVIGSARQLEEMKINRLKEKRSRMTQTPVAA